MTRILKAEPGMTESFEGQVAIVTGAGSAEGIGLAIARRLFEEYAFVVITATSERIHTRAQELDPSDENAVPMSPTSPKSSR
jgi:3-oxoacyl-[acyl-carrier protein] reductase